MRIEKLKIFNFKLHKRFEFTLNPITNIIVGDNETGKSTILEAINLALTGTLNGRPLRNELTPYLFNIKCQQEYLQSLSTEKKSPPPEILIELYLEGEGPEFARLEGNANSERKKAAGVAYRIHFDEDYQSQYEQLVTANEIHSIPIEYYRVSWRSFAREEITSRSLPLKPAIIDSGSFRMQSGSDLYVSRIVRQRLDDKERAAIAQAHRQTREFFMQNPNVQRLNAKIAEAGKVSDKEVTISVDLGTQNAWEGSLVMHVDKIPFHYIGKGEQCVIKTKLALSNKKSQDATALLIEEPETHLSHANLNHLLDEICSDNADKQIIATTHSSFVANKLGLDNLILLRGSNAVRIDALEAREFFQKLAGYDTLRLVLSSKAILVEGDSDELVVQRAYMDANDGRLPIEDRIDVISVGTSFLRFLELATALSIPVAVVTDNDGDPAALEKKYAKYKDVPTVTLCYDPEIDVGPDIEGEKFNYNTLEPKLLKANGLATLNEVFGTDYESEAGMLRHMSANKTSCALKIFSSPIKVQYPEYIRRAIAI